MGMFEWLNGSEIDIANLFIHILHFKFSLYRMDYVNLGCCALAFVLYLNTLGADFVYDDR